MQRIVVGIDGSETAAAALSWAISETRLRNAQLDVVLAWQMPYIGSFPYAAAFDPTPFEQVARQTVDSAMTEAEGAGLGHPPQSSLMNGGAAEAVLDAAKGADMVVIGSRGLGGFKGMLLGSVSQQIAHHATCPVVIVPSSS